MKSSIWVLLCASALASAAPTKPTVATFKAEVTRNPKDPTQLTLAVSMEIAKGHHAYSGKSDVHRATTVSVKLPESVTADGEVLPPVGDPHPTEAGVTVLKESAVFLQKLKAKPNATGKIAVEVDYQLCNEDKCLAPALWKTAVDVPVAGADSKAAGAGYTFKSDTLEAPVQLKFGATQLPALPSPALFDVDGDGRKDMVIGGLMGGFQTFSNLNAGKGEPKWGNPKYLLTQDGKRLNVNNWCCIGMTPQFVDLNGDGHTDIVAPSFAGWPYFVKGTAKGFQEPEKMLDSAGNVIRLSFYWDEKKSEWATAKRDGGEGHCTTVTAVDWDADGDTDLLLGSKNDGRVYLLLNEGTAKEPKFATAVQLVTAGKQKTRVGHPNLGSVSVGDWNGDGLFDIIWAGDHDGGVYVYENVGRKGKPEFADEKCLVESVLRQGNRDVPSRNNEPLLPGQNLHTALYDYDGDGKLDLLVGSCTKWKNEDYRPLTAKDQAVLNELLAETEKVKKTMADMRAKDKDAYKSEEYRALSRKWSENYAKTQKLEPKQQLFAHSVWFFRRK